MLALRWYESVRGKELGVDRPWVEKTRREAQSGIDKLEVELKGYTTNLIKESIRVSSWAARGGRELMRGRRWGIGILRGFFTVLATRKAR